MNRPRFLLITFALSALAMALFRLPNWIVEQFGDISLEQAWFHLTLDSGQTLNTVPTALLRATARELLLKPVLWAAGITGLVALLLRRWPHRRGAAHASVWLLALGLTGVGLGRTAQALNLQDQWQLPDDTPDWMGDYATPDLSGLAQQLRAKPRNLVLIYVESLQNRFVTSDRPLARWRAQHTGAERFHTLPGTQWTLGGMVASQCGLPLMPSGWSGRNNFDEKQAPLRGAICLGDVLRAAGYETAFVGGADPSFAGKQYFLHDHGFNQIYGREDIHRESGKSWPDGWWGAEDHDMLAYATDVLDDLERDGKPFYLSLLTLDTHGPTGRASSHCKGDSNGAELPAIYTCSLDAVERFLNELERRGRLNDTVVVLMGDHPLMAAGWSSKRPASENDTSADVFFAMAAPNQSARTLPPISHFDVPALALQAMLDQPEQALAFALGRTPPQEASLVQRDGRTLLAARLRVPSSRYQELWEVRPAQP